MALTLTEAAKLHSGDVMRSAIIELFARNSDILQVLPFDDITGNAIKFVREDILPSVSFRGVNEAYSEDVGTMDSVTEALFISGGDLDVDKYIVETMGADQRAVRETMKVKALAHQWTKKFLKGDNAADPREFNGLQVRLSGSQLITPAAGASGGDPLSLTELDKLIDAVDMPTHLIMNKTMKRRLTAASRNSGVGGYIVYTQDAFGRQVASYQDLPILIADEDETGAQILPFTEANPGGGSAASTSLYCVSFDEGMLNGIQNGTMDVRDLGEIDTKPVFRTRIEWYAGVAMYHSKSAARLQGIKDAAVIA